MHLISGNIFQQKADVICVTTNGFVKANGNGVMGRGVAKQAVKLYPGQNLEAILGQGISLFGNSVFPLIKYNKYSIYSFPVKPRQTICYEDKSNVVKHMADKFQCGDIVPGWAAKATLEIIERSLRQIIYLADINEWKKIIIPRPGCGNGELSWNSVLGLLDKYIGMDNRFYIISI